MDWGDEPRKKIGSLMKARRDSGAAAGRVDVVNGRDLMWQLYHANLNV